MEQLFDRRAPIAVLIATDNELKAFLKIAERKADMIAKVQKATIKTVGINLEPLAAPVPFGQYYIMTIGRQRVIVLQTLETIRCAAKAVNFVSWCCGAKLIINFGTAGALKPEVKESDMYLIQRIVQSDFDISGGMTKRKAKRLGLPYLMPGQHPSYASPFIYTNEELRAWVKSKCSTIREASIASSNKFMFDQDKIDVLAKFDVDMVDMESAGIELTAHEEKIPTLIFKCISDAADGLAADYYQNAANVSEAGSAFLIDLIQQM